MNPLNAMPRLPETEPERSLEIATLRSEIMRTRVVAGIFFFLTLWTLMGTYLLGSRVSAVAPQLPMSPLMVAAMAAAVIYALLAGRVFAALLAKGRRPPVLSRYGNAMFELFIITGILLLVVDISGIHAALGSPVANLYFLMIILSTLRLDPHIALFTGIMAMAQFLMIVLAFHESFSPTLLDRSTLAHTGHGLTLLASGLLAAFVTAELRRRFIEQFAALHERERTVNLFGQHVSPQVAERLLTQGSAGETERRAVCVLFLDIRNFTSFSEALPPEDVVRYLDALFEALVRVINEHGGIVNKFLGDGLMAIFGAPLPDARAADHAVAAALAMLREVEMLVDAGTIAPTRIGIGLHAGEAVTGIVGSEQRKEYTVIGDVVNLAARVEQLNKQLGTQLLLTDVVWGQLSEPRPSAAAHEPIAVRGRAEPVALYALPSPGAALPG